MQKRYLSIGFDDFRRSDFARIFPLFSKYGAKATYNRISNSPVLSPADVALVDLLENTGNEVGDHSWFHCNYIYNDPLCNGQDPDMPEGIQVPFPSNEQMREDRGDGRNDFGLDLHSDIEEALGFWYLYPRKWPLFRADWSDLTDEQCQLIRNHFSIYRDTSGMLDILDKLSNTYLGTAGTSRGSWSSERNCYTGGIFTGSRTSCNHEIWERVAAATKAFYQDRCGRDFLFHTWSWPGSIYSPFVFREGDKLYYDAGYIIPYNYLARFPSSMVADGAGRPKLRSWTQVLREAGYTVTHDTVYPSKYDGQIRPMMSRQLIYNARFSRKDALVYSTERTISYLKIADEYDEKFFSNSTKSRAAQMYDARGEFYKFIEAIRHDTSNGIVHGEVIDSTGTYSEQCFLEQVLEYCRKTGVEVISHERAYDICFKELRCKGNLIYNPSFRNTAREFMPDAEMVPRNPDGYQGNCYAVHDGSEDVLVIDGHAEYLHFGIPVGNIAYSANITGIGSIFIYAIKNSDHIMAANEELEQVARCDISNRAYKNHVISCLIRDEEETAYEQLCEGLGQKITGVKIVYHGNLKIKDIYMESSPRDVHRLEVLYSKL